MTAYTRNGDGTLAKTQLSICDGEINIGTGYNPAALTAAGTTPLMGWGKNDGIADIYKTKGGREIIVPERIAAAVRAAIEATK